MQRFSMLSDAGQSKSDGRGHVNVQALAQLWHQVHVSRGTPAPDAAHLASFVAGLSTLEREKIENALVMAIRGREQPGDFSLISWAASCTRPALLAQLAGHGLVFTGSALFSCGLTLRDQGWDIQARLAQLTYNPADVAALHAMLPSAPETSVRQAASSPELMLNEAPLDDSLPDDAPPEDDTAPDWPDEPMDDMAVKGSSAPGDAVDTVETITTIGEPEVLPASSVSNSESFKSTESTESIKTFKGTVPVLPTRFERETTLSPPSPSPSRLYSALPSPGAKAPATRQRGGNNDEAQQPKLRLFGKSAAHTLEVTDHRRGSDFLGTHVVSIDSAAAHGSHGIQITQSTSSTYAWERKLVVQLTPEEMPAIVATLMGITPSARFGNHGADKSKFIEVRRQEGGLLIVTGDKAGSYSVPVPTRTAYYVLDLFCRAMAMSMTKDGPGRNVSDILALVKAVHGF